jgi:hypothetical protein
MLLMAGCSIEETMLVPSIFYPINKGGRVVRRRMTDQAVYVILQVRALKTGVKLFLLMILEEPL